MDVPRHSFEPCVICADNDPDVSAYISDMVAGILGKPPVSFDDSESVLQWCAEHPIHADAVIAREGEYPFNGFKILRLLDAVFLRPVGAILLINPRVNAASAVPWFEGLGPTFKNIVPVKAICMPYHKHEIGTAIWKAPGWWKQGQNTANNKQKLRG